MDRSNWTFDGTPNWPVSVKLGEDGLFRVTSPMLKGKEWTGASEELAMRAFRVDTEHEYEKEELGETPKWIHEVREGKW